MNLGQVLKTCPLKKSCRRSFYHITLGKNRAHSFLTASTLMTSYGIMADTSVELALSVPLPSTDRTT